MELGIIFTMLSMLSSEIIRTAAPASLGDDSLSSSSSSSSSSMRHSRPKRCSCATFLDKECVYFCHLDIIWVNTPERTVSYGLGNTPRKKRSAQLVTQSTVLPQRCQCPDNNDSKCLSFCNSHKLLRHKAARDKVILTASGHDCAEKKCKYDLAAKSRGIKRALKKHHASIARASRQLHFLLEKWQFRWPHKVPSSAAETTI